MQIEFLLKEAFRNYTYDPIKSEGDIFVFKLSHPLKVNHLGKIHTTDIICYNTNTKTYSGGIQEQNGDVKIPPSFAFVFTIPDITWSDSKIEGIRKFKKFLNSKGYFSEQDIKDNKNIFIPKIDIRENPPNKTNSSSIRTNRKYKVYDHFPTEQEQKKLILKYAPESNDKSIYFMDFREFRDKDGKIKWQDLSGFTQQLPSLGVNPINLDAKDYIQIQRKKDLISHIVYKKILNDILFVWVYDSGVDQVSKVYFLTKDKWMQVSKQYISSLLSLPKITNKYDIEDKGEFQSPQKELGQEIVFNDINKIQPDEPEEVEKFKAERAKKKAEEDAQQAALKKELEQSRQQNQEKKKEKRKLEMD